MGSGRKSNGVRPVNKVDGPKKLGKKQMSKSRRVDFKNIVENEMKGKWVEWYDYEKKEYLVKDIRTGLTHVCWPNAGEMMVLSSKDDETPLYLNPNNSLVWEDDEL